MKNKRVVVTGMGVVAPNGVGVESFSQAIKKSKSGIQYHERLDELGFKCKIGGVPAISEELKAACFSELFIKQMAADGILFGCMAGIEAWKNADLPYEISNKNETDWLTGCIFGAGLAGADVVRDSAYQIDDNKIKRLGSTAVPQTMSSGVSAHLGGLLGLGNWVTTNASACATGTEAILIGYDHIKSGKAKRMVCGSCDSASPYVWAGFDAMRVLTRKFNDSPELGSRPLSASASGFVPGGGAGALILEDMESALERNVPIYAEVLGGARNAGGHRNGGSMTAANPEGIRRCIQSTLDNTGVQPKEIDLISGHLTATIFDPYEVRLWLDAFGSEQNFPYINALKSMTGHCLSASGAIEAVAGVLQISEGFIHASINCEDLHPKVEARISKNKIPQNKLNIAPQIIISSSFGFGDINSCLVLKNFNHE